LGDLLARAGDVQVVLARELTKTHEELVRGQITRVLEVDFRELGEFTVVAEIGLPVEQRPASPRPDLLLAEFGVMTNHDPVTRREAVAVLTKRHKMTRNQVYQAIENARKSVNRPT
jgi:16S rRNA C1402 (ribose-2'-O) methylase RsmI